MSSALDTELGPNRYAGDHEAKYLRGRLIDDDIEHEVLTRRVARANVALASVEAEFREFEKHYHALKKARETASNYRDEAQARLVAHEALLARQRALLHPMRKTSIEILCQIFEYCCPLSRPSVEDHRIGQRARRSDQAAPLDLARVCRRWRSACLGHSALWSVVDLHFDGLFAPRIVVRRVNYVATLLLRSRSSPITIRLVKTKAKPRDNVDWNPLLDIISDGLPRCQSLSIHADLKGQPSPRRDELTVFLEKPTPQLRYLFLSGSFFNPSKECDGVLLKNAPLLTTIRTQVASNFATRLALQPSVIEYRDHDAVFGDSHSMCAVLSACRNLEVLRLDLTGDTFQACIGYIHTATRTLRDLTINTRDADVSDLEVTRLLCKNFTFPALTAITLHGNVTGSGHRITMLNAYKASTQQLCLVNLASPTFQHAH